MKDYTGPCHADGTPDMDSDEWNTWCSEHFHAMARELDLITAMESANLPEQLDQDARNLLRLIRENAPRYEDSWPGLEQVLLQGLARLVDAAAKGVVQP